MYRPLQQRAAGLLPGGQAISTDSGGRPAATAHSSTAFSSKCGQCHVVR